jgi:hypothetical protein
MVFNSSNPFQIIQQIAGGYCLPSCLQVVADIGVADVLNETPQTATELPERVSANGDAFARILRFLSISLHKL